MAIESNGATTAKDYVHTIIITTLQEKKMKLKKINGEAIEHFYVRAISTLRNP